MSHPTTRVLAVLELLQSQSQVSGAELARRVGVDRRTLRRYIAMLEEMGIPITTEQGRYGGYRLVAGYKLPPMMFTDEEAQALSLGLIAARGLGLADAAPAIESVQAKLDRVLPNAPKRTIAALRESVALQTGDARVNADTKLLRVLSESAQTRCSAVMSYRAADGVITTRHFDVYGLVYRGGRWYVVGFCHLRSGLRTLRLDRVAQAQVTTKAFVRRKDSTPPNTSRARWPRCPARSRWRCCCTPTWRPRSASCIPPSASRRPAAKACSSRARPTSSIGMRASLHACRFASRCASRMR